MNIHSLQIKKMVILHSFNPFLQDRKTNTHPSCFVKARSCSFGSTGPGTVLSRRIGVHQLFQLHNGLSTWGPQNPKEKTSKTQGVPVSAEIPFYKSSFSEFFLIFAYFCDLFWEQKKRAKHPKKTPPTPSQPPQELFRLEFSKAPIWCPLSSIFSAIFFATKKRATKPETFHWSTGCLNDGILLLVYYSPQIIG